jgi:hypothetical protein
MPTILHKDGYRLVIYPNDHVPAHVHVLKGDAEIRIDLGDEERRPTLLSIRGSISNKEVARGLELVIANQMLCLEQWREIHE